MHAPASSVPGTSSGPAPARLLPGVFALVIFVNAALLFMVQPMFTRMVLPLLGGTAAVWNTCLLFFQAALLLGYLYAHAGSRRLPPGRQGLVHLTLLVTALATLPIGIPAWIPSPEQVRYPVAWLLAVLAVSLGLPFTLLAAGAPMFQRWFASTSHPGAGNPYVLYVASNLGSFAALVAYPFVVEPSLSLTEQRLVWMWGYVVLVALVLVAWWMARRWPAGEAPVIATRPVSSPPAEADGETTAANDLVTPDATRSVAAPSGALRLRWVLLSFAPSSLLLGVTSFLSTDVAAVPLLWVVPLALYLFTFVLVFARKPLLSRGFMLGFHLFVGLTLLVVIGMTPTKLQAAYLVLHLLGFFSVSMVCHRELADTRPAAEHLTSFYLWMSFGGMLGGAFNVLFAPLLYTSVLEYPLALIIAFGLRPLQGTYDPGRRPLAMDLLLAAAVFGAMLAAFEIPVPSEGRAGSLILWSVFALVGLGVATFRRRPLRLALGAAAMYFAIDHRNAASRETVVHQSRSFFGVYRVSRWDHFLVLQSGTTTHGAQDLQPGGRREPLTYYTRSGPLGDIFTDLTDTAGMRRVALVGLGTGTTACHAKPGEPWTYFEIDPTVVEIARSGRYFTYIKECGPGMRIVVGDARLTLQREPEGAYDLIVLDAFSSDAIPVHLMTREAIQMYRARLAAHGVLAFHVSNRYLALEPVLAALAAESGLFAVVRDDAPDDEARRAMHYGSRWVVLASDRARVAPLLDARGWRVAERRAGVRGWTDDYSNIVRVLKSE